MLAVGKMFLPQCHLILLLSHVAPTMAHLGFNYFGNAFDSVAKRRDSIKEVADNFSILQTQCQNPKNIPLLTKHLAYIRIQHRH